MIRIGNTYKYQARLALVFLCIDLLVPYLHSSGCKDTFYVILSFALVLIFLFGKNASGEASKFPDSFCVSGFFSGIFNLLVAVLLSMILYKSYENPYSHFPDLTKMSIWDLIVLFYGLFLFYGLWVLSLSFGLLQTLGQFYSLRVKFKFDKD